jgi:hypothetical protein
MADPRVELEQLIKEHTGVLVRQKKHKVYRFPNGLNFILSSTPECPLAYDNALSSLKKVLGINDPNRGLPGERREKRIKRKNTRGSKMPPSGSSPIQEPVSWKQQLAVANLQLAPAPVVTRPAVVLKKRHLTFEERMLRAGVKRVKGKE